MLAAGATTVEVYTSFIYRGWHVAGLLKRELLGVLGERGLTEIASLQEAPTDSQRTDSD
jgi:dihydroorotate dehydrogenase